jgi:hypothetical protein
MQNLFELAEEIGIKLRKLGKKSKKIGISLRGSFSIHKERTFFDYINSGKDIFNRAERILSEDFDLSSQFTKQEYIRQISIWAGSLENESNLTLSLFDQPIKQNKIGKAVDEINSRFGNHTIRNGFLLYADKLATQPNGFMADKLERKQLAEKGVNWNKQLLEG